MIARLSAGLLCVALCLVADPALAQATAVVEGRIVLDAGPARRTAARYPSGPSAAKQMQSVAAVVYLTGPGLATGPVTVGPGADTPVDVLQRDTLFMPSAIAVQTGAVVRFPNGDPFFHNVFSYSPGARFDLGRYPEGESRQVTFARPGIARVFCEVHEFMRAVVLVTDHPFHAVVGEDGSFRMEGVPPGEHTLAAYHPDLGTLEQRLVVRAGEVVRVEVGLGG
jgi:plastocyanin